MIRFLFIIKFLFIYGAFAGAQDGGHWVGNGGDSLAQYIESRARVLVTMVEKLPEECQRRLPISVASLKRETDRAQITTTPKPIYVLEKGKLVYKEAVNDPETGNVTFNRNDFLKSLTQDLLILHELVGLARVPDVSFRNSESIIRLIESAACQTQDSATIDMMQSPHETAIGADGIIYLLVRDSQVVERFSLLSLKSLPPLEASAAIKTMALSLNGKRLYVAHENREISYFDLAGTGKEILFVKADLIPRDPLHDHDAKKFNRSEIEALIAGVNGLAVVPNNNFSWINVIIFDHFGKKIRQSEWVEPYVSSSISPVANGYFFVSGFSSRNLHFFPFTPIRGDRPRGETLEDDEGRHKQVRISGPIVASPLYVAVGSGHLYSADPLRYLKALKETFDLGVFVKNQLITGKKINAGYILQSYRPPEFSEPIRVHQVQEGALVAMHSWRNRLVVLSREASGNIRVSVHEMQ